MRLLLALTAVFALLIGAATTTQAAPLKWYGTTITILGSGKPVVFTGTGVATINGSSGGYGHLNQIFVDGGISGTNTAPVTDPEVTVGGIVSNRATLFGGVGSFANISGGGPLAINFKTDAQAKVCLYDPNCVPGSFLLLNLREHKTLSTSVGLGIGGVQTIGGVGLIRISLVHQPYTLGTAQAIDQTDNGDFIFRTVTGFAHGPASLTSSTALPSGAVQFVAPTQISTNITTGTNELLSLSAQLRYHFIPEPGIFLLISSGVVGLVLLGRSRMNK